LNAFLFRSPLRGDLHSTLFVHAMAIARLVNRFDGLIWHSCICLSGYRIPLPTTPHFIVILPHIVNMFFHFSMAKLLKSYSQAADSSLVLVAEFDFDLPEELIAQQ